MVARVRQVSLAMGLVLAASCGGSSSGGGVPESSASVTVAPSSSEVPSPEQSDSSGAPDVAEIVDADPFTVTVADLPPPTGRPFRLGLVNTEGVPGLDFPEIRTVVEAVVAYVNQHGGFGGRPVQLVTCVAAGSPESSQACAQEVVGQGIELVLLGFDLFAPYPTYAAESVPVIGVLPILPPDYQAEALFVTGGNLTVTAAMAGVAVRHVGARTVAIISADDVGSNSTEASFTAALDAAGITHVSIKGGINETDAGFQGLFRQASRQGADLLVSLYGGDGCLGAMRARVALGLTTPVLTTTACAEARVIDQAGDDAQGWIFAGSGENTDTPDDRLIRTIVAAASNVTPDQVDTAALGLGILGLIGSMSLAKFAHLIADAGDEVTGASLYEFMRASNQVDFWPSGPAKACGAAPMYPSICSFDFPVAHYVPGQGVKALDGLASVSALDHLP